MKKFFSLFFSVVLILSLLEILSRFTLKIIYNRDFDSGLIVEKKYFSSDGLKENAAGKVWGKNFCTDESGCRKNSKSSSQGKKKWLFIGDSVTEGVGVDDSCSFSSIASGKIDSLNILNYSLIGYSISDYFNLLKFVLENDSSVKLATVFFCLNDIYGSAKTGDLPVMAKQNIIGKLNEFLRDRYATYKLLKIIMFQNANRYFQYDSNFYEKENPFFTESMNYLNKCFLLCEEKNIEMNLVMLPYRSQLSENSEAKPQLLVKEFCERNKIPFYNALDFLRMQKEHKKLYLFADEIHFSEEGHRAIAEYLFLNFKTF